MNDIRIGAVPDMESRPGLLTRGAAELLPLHPCSASRKYAENLYDRSRLPNGWGDDFVGIEEQQDSCLPVIPEVMIMARLGIARIVGICLAENAASAKVMERCGFVKEFEGIAPYQGEKRNICKYCFVR